MPVKRLLTILIFLFSTMITARIKRQYKQKTFLIMLDPAGDAKQTGRKLGDSFERGITLQYVETLKKILQKEYPFVNVMLTRFPGDIIYELQNASYANRLGTNLYISINFFQTQETKPSIYLYQFSYHDDFISPTASLTFYLFDHAHLHHLDTTRAWGHLFKSVLEQKEYKSMFAIKGIYKLPFKPLIGITAPAIGIEIGLKKKGDWNQYVEPVSNAIGRVMETARA